MAQGIEHVKEELFEVCPLLELDPLFRILQDANDTFNCIAWACQMDNVWMWPLCANESRNDDVIRFWPPGFEHDASIQNFVRVFQYFGYSVCDNWYHEKGFQKIALYVDPVSQECTHAAREIVADDDQQGAWTSKLGKGCLVQHMSPFSLDESVFYGDIHCFMKKQITALITL